MHQITLLGGPPQLLGLGDMVNDCLQTCAKLSGSSFAACSASCKNVYVPAEEAQAAALAPPVAVDDSWYTQWWGIGLIVVGLVGAFTLVTRHPAIAAPRPATATKP